MRLVEAIEQVESLESNGDRLPLFEVRLCQRKLRILEMAAKLVGRSPFTFSSHFLVRPLFLPSRLGRYV